MFPVENVLGEIKRHLAANRDVVLTAPPGSGKTTCVPAALMDEPWLNGGKILMLEPRRLAARNCARYIARKRGESVGASVGYQVRLERKVSAATRLEIVTEGLLTQRLLSDPELSGVGLVVFDEFHERSLACDTGFALALEVRRALRDDLRLLVMSATLDADEVAAHLGDAAIVRAEGRMFPVETRYLDDMPLAGAVRRALAETDGDVLCFLPGEGEIRRSAETLAGIDAEVLLLYGALPKEAQDLVFQPSPRRKVILATSIAETSVTIEGVTAVVDSGLMRVSRFSPSTGMSRLATLPLTMDRAEQRRGRAGRVRAGICYRLWNEADDRSRPQKALPEILEADLASTVLSAALWGTVRIDGLPWLTPPPESAWGNAVSLLQMLGALDGDGRITEAGRKMARFAAHPRLANMMIMSGAADLAAIIEEGAPHGITDIHDVRLTPRMKELARRWRRMCTDEGSVPTEPGEALAYAFPDRIGRNRGNGTFQLSGGRGAFLDRTEALSREEFLVCCDLDDRGGDARIRLAAAISREAIEEIFSDMIRECETCSWDRRQEAVKTVRQRTFGKMVLEEHDCQHCASEEAVQNALFDGIRRKGVANLPCWTKGTRRLQARIAFLRKAMSEADPAWPDVSDEGLAAHREDWFSGFASGMTRWAHLESLDIAAVMDFALSESGHDRRELDRLAPSKMDVPSGSEITIQYEEEGPFCEVRLQECFGMLATPKVAGGKVPVVMRLLSPAQRPVQVTKDLASFWKEGYPLVRKDMRGRYPKHYWPEDPFTAVATRRVRPQ